jgi:hypothetical protein
MLHKYSGHLAGVAVAVLVSQPWTASAQVTQPAGTVLVVAMSHAGNFTVGTNGAYSIVVSNIGVTASVPGIHVDVEWPAAPFQFVSVMGTGWNCFLSSPSSVDCAGGSVAAGGSAFPITLTVVPQASGTVPITAELQDVSSQVLAASTDVTHVTGAGPTPMEADLSIAVSHSGNFTVGMNGVYTIVVSNIGGTASSGSLYVSDELTEFPGQFVSATGTGWSCSLQFFGFPNTHEFVDCTSTSVIAAGGSASPITLMVIPQVGRTVANTAVLENLSLLSPVLAASTDVTIIVAAVPTLPEWAMIALTALLALAGVTALRRRTT